MNPNIIQSQITLIGFKAIKLEFSCDEANSKLEPFFNLRLSDLLIEDNPNCFSKVFNIDLVVQNTSNNETVKITVEYHSTFQCSEKIDSAFLDSDFVKISAPAIGFPYLRAFISNLTVQAGIPPLVLPSINFVQFNNELQKEKTNSK